jgi:hypothetical protein
MLTIEEKVRLIRELCKKHQITAYQIGKNTPITAPSARNVLEKDDIKPRNSTLNIILEYIENTITGTEAQYEINPDVLEEHKRAAKNQLSESESFYGDDFDTLSIENKLKTLYLQNKKILEMDEKLDQVAQALSILLIDTDSIKDKLEIKDDVKNDK